MSPESVQDRCPGRGQTPETDRANEISGSEEGSRRSEREPLSVARSGELPSRSPMLPGQFGGPRVYRREVFVLEIGELFQDFGFSHPACEVFEYVFGGDAEVTNARLSERFDGSTPMRARGCSAIA